MSSGFHGRRIAVSRKAASSLGNIPPCELLLVHIKPRTGTGKRGMDFCKPRAPESQEKTPAPFSLRSTQDPNGKSTLTRTYVALTQRPAPFIPLAPCGSNCLECQVY